MGCYINPINITKEQWIEANGKPVSRGKENPELDLSEISSDDIICCLVDNGHFTALGVAYNKREYDSFAIPDGRLKEWYVVPIEKVLKICPEAGNYIAGAQ